MKILTPTQFLHYQTITQFILKDLEIKKEDVYVLLYITVLFTNQIDLSASDNDNEALSMEITNQRSKNIIIDHLLVEINTLKFISLNYAQGCFKLFLFVYQLAGTTADISNIYWLGRSAPFCNKQEAVAVEKFPASQIFYERITSTIMNF